jgi:hypothetical protein
MQQEASSSFLKKRTKKLFPNGVRGPIRRMPVVKSFLVLFFKKELLASFLLVFACTWMAQSGPAVSFRHFGIPLCLLAAAILFAPRVRHAGPVLLRAAPALPAAILFLLLVGIGGMANHGADFARTSHDFWHADVLVATDRRPVLPAIAHILLPYGVLWYGCFVALFLTAWQRLATSGLAPAERFALLTASILAYLLIIPGYTEVLTYLVALLCWRAELTVAEKCMAGAIMIGGHEFAGAFCLAFLAIEAEGADRRAWIGTACALFAIYAAGYVLSAGAGLAHDISIAAHPAAVNPLSAWQLDLAHSGRCVLGILAAYKLFWLLVPAGLLQTGRTRLHAVFVLLALPLILIASDTSRIVQFGSLSLFAVVAGTWPLVSPKLRRALTYGSLLLPSIAAFTLTIPAWGKGLYIIYLWAAKQFFGVELGGVAF